jgi:hypothetical protein
MDLDLDSILIEIYQYSLDCWYKGKRIHKYIKLHHSYLFIDIMKAIRKLHLDSKIHEMFYILRLITFTWNHKFTKYGSEQREYIKFIDFEFNRNIGILNTHTIPDYSVNIQNAFDRLMDRVNGTECQLK